MTALLCLLAIGCARKAGIHDVHDVPVVQGVDMDEMHKAIVQACASLGWTAQDVKPGLIRATINVRNKHTAVVNIPYDTQKYSILYESSENLKDDGKGNIHKNYNSWVINLERAINKYIAMSIE